MSAPEEIRLSSRGKSASLSLFPETTAQDSKETKDVKLPSRPVIKAKGLPPDRRASNVPVGGAIPSFVPDQPTNAPPPGNRTSPPPVPAPPRPPPPPPPERQLSSVPASPGSPSSTDDLISRKKSGFYNVYSAKAGMTNRQSTVLSARTRSSSQSVALEAPLVPAAPPPPPPVQGIPSRKSSAFVPDDHFDHNTMTSNNENPLRTSGVAKPSLTVVASSKESCPSEVLMRSSIHHQYHNDEGISALECQEQGMEMDIEQASQRKASKQQQEESKEGQRMSVVISAGASTEVILEVFAEMINSIGRLRTSLNSEDTTRSRPYSANPHADFEKTLNRISSALHSSLKVLDAFRENIEPKGQWAWAPYAKRFSSDLVNANEMLSQIRILLIKLHGAHAMVDVTALVDKMIQRIKLRIDELGQAVSAFDKDQQKRSAKSLRKSLVEEKGFEKERERLQILAEADVVSQKCHRSGELEKLPIVKRTQGAQGVDVRAGVTAEIKAKTADKGPQKPTSNNWRRRYFFLDYKALTYTHNTKGQSDVNRPEDTTSTSLEIDHSSSAFTVDEKTQPGVFTVVHSTYEFTMRAESVDEGYLWVNAVNVIGGVHRARNDRERRWFAEKSQNQWWGDMVPEPGSLDAKNWETLFASVIQRWPTKTADLITPKDKNGNFRTTSSDGAPSSEPQSPASIVPGAPEGVVAGLSVSLANRLRGHADQVTTVSWSGDGQHVVSGSKECRVNIWSVPPAASLSIEVATGTAVATSAAAAAAGLGVLKPTEELNMGSGANWTLASCFSPSNRFVAVAGLNQKISVGDWRFQHGRSYALHPLGNGDEHLGAVTALCWMGREDGVLASGCSDSYLRIWDVSSRKMITRLDAQEDEVQCLAAHEWVPAVVLSGGADCNVRIHDARNARSCVGLLKGAESDVEDVRIFGNNSTTANFVASASRDGYCRIHDLRQPASPVMTTLVPENRGFTAIDFSSDGRWLYAAAARNEWLVVDAYTGHTVLKVNGHGGIVNCLRATPDGRVCTGSDDQQICVWNVDLPKYW